MLWFLYPETPNLLKNMVIFKQAAIWVTVGLQSSWGGGELSSFQTKKSALLWESGHNTEHGVQVFMWWMQASVITHWALFAKCALKNYWQTWRCSVPWVSFLHLSSSPSNILELLLLTPKQTFRENLRGLYPVWNPVLYCQVVGSQSFKRLQWANNLTLQIPHGHGWHWIICRLCPAMQ